MSWAEGFCGQATVYAEKYNTDGTLFGSVFILGNVTSQKKTSNNEAVDLVSRMYGTAGSSFGTRMNKAPSTLALMGNTFFKEVWEIEMLGTAVDNAGGSVTDEPFTAVHDKPVFIGFPGAVIDTDGITDAATGLTVYTEGTDYTYDAQTSLFTALSTGTITDGEDLFADLIKPTTGYKIAGDTELSKSFRLIIKGKNERTGRNFTRIIHKFTPLPTGDIDDVQAEDQSWTFTGSMELPAGFTSPYDFYYDDGSA